MSKPVRIRGDVAARVDERALAERRSFANMVEMLLLAALTERGVGGGNASGGDRVAPARVGPSPLEKEPVAPRSVSADELVRSVAPEDTTGGIVPAVPPRVHDVPMQKQAADLALRDGKCGADVAFGTKCKLCGKVHD